MKLWVDDLREPPGPEWVWAKDAQSAISHLYMAGVPAVMDHIEEISLDNDLGSEEEGKHVLEWMSSWDVWPDVLTIHTSNRSAREEMLRAANADGPASMEIYVIYDHLRKVQ